MDQTEVTGMVWKILASAQSPQTAEDISVAIGLDTSLIRKSLAPLREAQLLEVSKSGTRFSYTAILNLDALGWARAADLGVPLMVLEKHASLSSGMRDQALKMALEGRLEVLSQERIAEKTKQREDIINGKAATRVAATDLARLIADTRAAAALGAQRKNPKDRAIQKVLDRAVSEADQALRGLVERMR